MTNNDEDDRHFIIRNLIFIFIFKCEDQCVFDQTVSNLRQHQMDKWSPIKIHPVSAKCLINCKHFIPIYQSCVKLEQRKT